MKKIKIILFLTFVLAGYLTISCDSTTIQEIKSVVTNPTYNTDIKPLMTTKCTSCHSANGENPALTNYAEVKNATQNGRLLCRIKGNCDEVMPPSGRLPQPIIDMVDLWKSQGYIEQ